MPAVRKWTFEWDGELRVPATGTYRLWATGRGEVRVVLDGHPVLEGAGEPLRAGADVPLQAGPHHLQVAFTRTGPGPRLRLGWTRPDRSRPPARPRRGDPAAAARPRVAGGDLGDHRPRSRSSWPRSWPPSPGSCRGTARAGRLRRRRSRAREIVASLCRPCGARAADELAARPRPRRLRRDGPARRPPQRLDPCLGRPRAGHRARPPLPGPGVPSAARRPRLLGEPARSGGAGRARDRARRPRSRLQRRPAAEHGRQRPRRAAPGPAGQRRSAGRVRRRRDLRRRRAPLDPPGAPARAGDAVPAVRPARVRRLLAEPDLAARAGGRRAARAAGVVVDLPGRDHRARPRGRHRGGDRRRASRT